MGFPCGSAGKESACHVGDLGSIPGLGRSPGEGNGYPTPVFWPGECHGLYIPWGHKESVIYICIFFFFAKSLQSCPTLYDPIDGSPPGFPVPGIL